MCGCVPALAARNTNHSRLSLSANLQTANPIRLPFVPFPIATQPDSPTRRISLFCCTPRWQMPTHTDVVLLPRLGAREPSKRRHGQGSHCNGNPQAEFWPRKAQQPLLGQLPRPGRRWQILAAAASCRCPFCRDLRDEPSSRVLDARLQMANLGRNPGNWTITTVMRSVGRSSQENSSADTDELLATVHGVVKHLQFLGLVAALVWRFVRGRAMRANS